MNLHQQTPHCSDFDVTIDGDDSPSFRVLLPEAIYGNACMHLHPVVAERLDAGETATIRGLVGIHHGRQEELERMLEGICGKR